MVLTVAQMAIVVVAAAAVAEALQVVEPAAAAHKAFPVAIKALTNLAVAAVELITPAVMVLMVLVVMVCLHQLLERQLSTLAAAVLVATKPIAALLVEPAVADVAETVETMPTSQLELTALAVAVAVVALDLMQAHDLVQTVDLASLSSVFLLPGRQHLALG